LGVLGLGWLTDGEEGVGDGLGDLGDGSLRDGEGGVGDGLGDPRAGLGEGR